MISFSKKTKAQWEGMSTYVLDRVYFVEGVGTFIGTSTSTYEPYFREVVTEVTPVSGVPTAAAVSSFVDSKISDFNSDFGYTGNNVGPVTIGVDNTNRTISGELLYNENQFKVESGTGKLQAALSGAKGEVVVPIE